MTPATRASVAQSAAAREGWLMLHQASTWDKQSWVDAVAGVLVQVGRATALLGCVGIVEVS
ncbi:hypothetical protein [Streptacidiphilus sp. MAP5-3]|uniref:hypothetical protein n=1 Tax=unclassified Streptacidiphilus TaxID=2643834 RepID=UPI0035113A25